MPCLILGPDSSLAVTTADAVDKLLEETSRYRDKVLAARRAAEEAEAAAAAAAAEGPSSCPPTEPYPGDSEVLHRTQRRHSWRGINYLQQTKPSGRLSCSRRVIQEGDIARERAHALTEEPRDTAIRIPGRGNGSRSARTRRGRARSRQGAPRPKADEQEAAEKSARRRRWVVISQERARREKTATNCLSR